MFLFKNGGQSVEENSLEGFLHTHTHTHTHFCTFTHKSAHSPTLSSFFPSFPFFVIMQEDKVWKIEAEWEQYGTREEGGREEMVLFKRGKGI